MYNEIFMKKKVERIEGKWDEKYGNSKKSC